MSNPPAWEIIRQLRQQKLSYYQNTLTDDAIWDNLSSSYDIFDFASFMADFTLSDTLFSSLMSYFLFDISLTEIVPINLQWDIELPTIDQFLQGVLIVLEPLNLSSLIPDLSDILGKPSLLLTPEARAALESSKLEKCIYGKSKYGNCYVDPIAVREFLRSTVLAFMKKWNDYKAIKDMMVATAKTLDIKQEVVEDIFNRLSKITTAKVSCATWDYAWWDVSLWCEEKTHSPAVGQLEYINFDLKPAKTDYQGLFDAQAGCIWDEGYWDMCFWVDDTPGKESPYIPQDDRIIKVQDALVSNFRSRFTSTAFAVANYQLSEERKYPFINQRMEIYAQNRGFALEIETLVKNFITNRIPGVDPTTLRFYVNAALELYGVSSDHKWGLEMQKSMSRDEYKRYWLEKYVQYGLDRDILNELWDKIIKTVDAYSDIRVKTRLSFLKKKLRLGA